MPELVILEILAGIFLLLPVLRQLAKNWEAVDGLYFLPFLALLICIGIFPAYGFRPECLPFLLYCGIRNGYNFPALSAVLSRAHNPGFSRGNRSLAFLSLLFLGVTLGIALVFVPLVETRLLTEGVASFSLTGEGGKGVLNVRVYLPLPESPPEDAGPAAETAADAIPAVPQAASAQRPVMFLIPPVMGSIPAVDLLCGSLRDRGFTVVTWSRRKFDIPAVEPSGKKRSAPLGQFFAVVRAFFLGRSFAGANNAGRALEAVRRRDAEFLLGYIARHGGFPELEEDGGSNWSRIFAAGFGTGGAALLELAGSAGFERRFPALRGIIALESPPFSALLQEAPPQNPPEPEGPESWFGAVSRGFSGWLRSFQPRRIAGMARVEGSALPLCIIASDRIRFPAWRNGHYAALIRSCYAARAPAALISVAGAGWLDYSGYPAKYPLLALPFPGKNPPVWAGSLQVSNTAALMVNFAASVREAEGGSGGPVRVPLGSRGILVESNSLWNSRGFPDILAP